MSIRRFDERTRDVLWALLAAVLLWGFELNAPVTQYTRAVQSRIEPKPMTGEIVFATSRASIGDPETPEQRTRLAQFLRELDAAHVKHVYVDVVFDTPSTPKADAELGAAIKQLGDRVSLVWRLSDTQVGSRSSRESIPVIAGTASQLPNTRWRNFLGFSWEVPSSNSLNGQEYTTLPVYLAETKLTGDIAIDYRFDPTTLPTLSIDRAFTTADVRAVHGNSVVIGDPGSAETYTINVPGLQEPPNSLIAIYAAETLKSGGITILPEIPLLAVFAACLLGISVFAREHKERREFLYLGLTVAIGVLLVLPIYTRVQPELGSSLFMVFWFALLRIRTRWQKRFALEDAKTGLPTFRAFEQALESGERPSAIVVAKVMGYEDVVKTLPGQHHATYVRNLLERFRVAEKELPIYANEGRYFAWASKEGHADALEEHLDGLRALFSTPIVVGGVEIDVGITFGVDMSAEPDAVQRIASATSAAEHTDEAHRPIIFAQLDEKSDALWKLSLQARIDNALENEEIYLVFQPKLDIETGAVVGAEALVRWDDPARGHISPAYFVQECERAGRMGHLTEYVLRHACRAAVRLRDMGLASKMSVNISATLFRDDRVEQMVTRILEDEGLNPGSLILEITETARIVDLERAVNVLERIRERGVGISIDDFGAGAANLEMLYRLPFDELKIDRVFIANLDSEKSSAIVQSIINFGKALRINVVAEGAESAETLLKLSDLGCRIVQGYAISPPREFDKFVEFQRIEDLDVINHMV